MRAIAICAAMCFTAVPAFARPPAPALATTPAEQATVPPAPAESARRLSAFGRAMGELTRGLREEKKRAAAGASQDVASDEPRVEPRTAAVDGTSGR